MKSVMRLLVPTVVLGMVLSGCGSTTSEMEWGKHSTETISGTISYRQRMPLPPHAVVSIALEDVSRMDAPSIVLRKKIFSNKGKQVPLPFELTYDPSQINLKHQYALRARIEIDGKLRFINDHRVEVITDPQKTHEIDVLLKMLEKN